MPIAKRMAVISQQQPFTIESVFSRVGVAYDKYGNQVPANTPRFGMAGVDEPGLLIEEGTTNLLTAEASQSLSSPYTTGTLNGTYTFSCKTGTITLSGGASGTVTPTNPITATISSATVTLTPATTATFNQIENKAYPTSWTLGGTTRNAETFTIPSSVLNIDTEGYSNLLPEAQSNSLSSGSPYTTSTLISGVTYTFSCTTGSYELSGGRGTVTPTNPITVTPGAVTITLTGDSTGNQLSATSTVKPWILGGTQQNNGAGTIEFEMYMNDVQRVGNSHYPIRFEEVSGRNQVILYYWQSGDRMRYSISDNTGTGNLINGNLSQSLKNGWVKIAISWDSSSFCAYLNGSPENSPTTNPHLPTNVLTFWIGNHLTSQIRNVVVSKTKRTNSDIQARADTGFPMDKFVTAKGLLTENLSFKAMAKV